MRNFLLGCVGLGLVGLIAVMVPRPVTAQPVDTAVAANYAPLMVEGNAEPTQAYILSFNDADHDES